MRAHRESAQHDDEKERYVKRGWNLDLVLALGLVDLAAAVGAGIVGICQILLGRGRCLGVARLESVVFGRK